MASKQNSLTDGDKATILSAVRSGLSRIDACKLARVPFGLFSEAIRDPEFAADVGRAEAEFELQCVASIQQAARKREEIKVTRSTKKDGTVTETVTTTPVVDWRAAAYLIERKG